MEHSELHHKLGTTARKIVEAGKGILAVDESPNSIGKRLLKHNIKNTPENRKKFRQLLFSTPDISDMLGGAILHEETWKQSSEESSLLIDLLIKKGISPGIKLDKGLIEFKDKESVSVGLEDLEKRLKMKIFEKAEFAKWRSVLTITDDTPTEVCVKENCQVLAKYAEICQRQGIVPIVEPEILYNGMYDVNEASRVAKVVLGRLMYELNSRNIYMQGIVLKFGFVTAGDASENKADIKTCAHKTFDVLISTVPCGVAAVVFLSGGHKPEESVDLLKAVNLESGNKTWPLSFSFGRAISDPVIEVWRGEAENTVKAQTVFKEQLSMCHKAITK